MKREIRMFGAADEFYGFHPLTLVKCRGIISRNQYLWRIYFMKRIKTLETKNLCQSAKNGGCGECQTSCQSACKTSCGIANQQCESKKESK